MFEQLKTYGANVTKHCRPGHGNPHFSRVSCDDFSLFWTSRGSEVPENRLAWSQVLNVVSGRRVASAPPARRGFSGRLLQRLGSSSSSSSRSSRRLSEAEELGHWAQRLPSASTASAAAPHERSSSSSVVGRLVRWASGRSAQHVSSSGTSSPRRLSLSGESEAQQQQQRKPDAPEDALVITVICQTRDLVLSCHDKRQKDWLMVALSHGTTMASPSWAPPGIWVLAADKQPAPVVTSAPEPAPAPAPLAPSGPPVAAYVPGDKEKAAKEAANHAALEAVAAAAAAAAADVNAAAAAVAALAAVDVAANVDKALAPPQEAVVVASPPPAPPSADAELLPESPSEPPPRARASAAEEATQIMAPLTEALRRMSAISQESNNPRLALAVARFHGLEERLAAARELAEAQTQHAEQGQAQHAEQHAGQEQEQEQEQERGAPQPPPPPPSPPQQQNQLEQQDTLERNAAGSRPPALTDASFFSAHSVSDMSGFEALDNAEEEEEEFKHEDDKFLTPAGRGASKAAGSARWAPSKGAPSDDPVQPFSPPPPPPPGTPPDSGLEQDDCSDLDIEAELDNLARAQQVTLQI